jgi:glycosyltransferase involved in cell wall biosynthesis
MVISIYPGIMNVLPEILSLQEVQRGRILAILICSNIALWFLVIYLRMALMGQRLQFDNLVRAVGAEKSQKDLHDSLTGSKIVVLIPAYNEAENLQKLLPRIPNEVEGEKLGVLVVDDGSDDSTYVTCREQRVPAIRNPIQRGGGAALRLGYDVLRTAGVQICITMDADGQHNPEEIGKLISPILDNRGDIVIGSRILGSREKDSPLRLFGVYFFSFIINRLLGTKITDPSSGFRAFKMNVLKSIYLYEDQYHTSELIINAAKEGKKIYEVPITIYRRRFGESKKGKNWQYGFHFAKTIISSWWR